MAKDKVKFAGKTIVHDESAIVIPDGIVSEPPDAEHKKALDDVDRLSAEGNRLTAVVRDLREDLVISRRGIAAERVAHERTREDLATTAGAVLSALDSSEKAKLALAAAEGKLAEALGQRDQAREDHAATGRDLASRDVALSALRMENGALRDMIANYDQAFERLTAENERLTAEHGVMQTRAEGMEAVNRDTVALMNQVIEQKNAAETLLKQLQA